jgi:hypothetical protein
MAATKAAKALIDSRLEAIRQGPSGHGAGTDKKAKVYNPATDSFE